MKDKTMKKSSFFIFIIFLFCFFSCSVIAPNRFCKPAQIEHVDTLHEIVISDPYKWMEDINSWKVLRFARTENRKIRRASKKIEKLYREFYEEVAQRQIVTSPDEELYDRPDGEYIYYTRSVDGSTLHYRKKRDSLDMEELMLDEKKELAGKDGFAIESYELSPNQQYIAYILFDENAEKRQLILKHRDSNTKIEFLNVYEFVWVNDSNILYSTDTTPKRRLYMHQLGSPQSTDLLIYEEPDLTSYLIDVELSKSKKYIFVHISNTTSFDETRYIDMEAPHEIKTFTQRENGLCFRVFHDVNDTVFYILTNLNAPNFKIVKTSINHTESDNWIDFMPESDYFIMDVKSTGTHFLLSEYGHGSKKLTLVEKQTGERRRIEFDEMVYDTELVHIDSLKKNIRFKYCSFLTPDTYYDYNYDTNQLTVVFETQVSNFRKDDYRVEYTVIPSYDSYPVPVTIVYNKNTPRDGTAPILTDVYGAEGEVWSTPYFHLNFLTLLDRGFYYVLPDVRGGGGRYSDRHRDGIVLGRKNTAYDMIAVSEFLINEKYTSAGKIHLSGGSAGGLALGMAVNMRPELFGSLVFQSPYLDVMLENTTERDWLEQGNPNIKEELVNILDFSPYNNVKKQTYPAMLFYIGLKDENVHPAGTFKMVTKLKANQIGTAPIFMNTDFKANHFNVQRMIRPNIFILAIHYNILP